MEVNNFKQLWWHVITKLRLLACHAYYSSFSCSCKHRFFWKLISVPDFFVFSRAALVSTWPYTKIIYNCSRMNCFLCGALISKNMLKLSLVCLLCTSWGLFLLSQYYTLSIIIFRYCSVYSVLRWLKHNMHTVFRVLHTHTGVFWQSVFDKKSVNIPDWIF